MNNNCGNKAVIIGGKREIYMMHYTIKPTESISDTVATTALSRRRLPRLSNQCTTRIPRKMLMLLISDAATYWSKFGMDKIYSYMIGNRMHDISHARVVLFDLGAHSCE